jgi:hypothetical protein
MMDEHRGFTAIGFTREQAAFLGALLNILKSLAEASSLGVREETMALRRVLKSKGVVSSEEIEAEKQRGAERFRELLDLESMVDPEFKKGLELLEERLRRRMEEGDEGNSPRDDQ